MPFIDVKVSCGLEVSKEERLKAELGKAIGLIPGKSEGSLMIQFTDHCRLWFAGQQDGPIAFLNVMVYGTVSREGCEKFKNAVIPLFQQELGAKRVYLKFEEVPNWFWN